jgi:hypothetical protein
MKNEKLLNNSAQFMLLFLTISAQTATSLKFPEWGLAIALISQPFWLYSSWKAYKQANQWGFLINTIIFTVVTALGVVNYWIL